MTIGQFTVLQFDSDFRVIGLAIVADASLPLITAGVGEVETALNLLESDAMTTAVAGGLGMVGILDVATDVEREGDDGVRNIITFNIKNSNFPKTQKDRSGHGIGLNQVQRRLDLAYPNRYEWTKGLCDEGKNYQSIIKIKV